MVVSNDPGQCAAIVTYSVSFNDNCAGANLAQTAGLASGSSFPSGTTSNSFTVTDGSGNTAACSFTVTVNDTEIPTITCPANVVVSNDPGQCAAIVTYSVSFNDNCAGANWRKRLVWRADRASLRARLPIALPSPTAPAILQLVPSR
ncbi:MAG: HYR domain-containing protein [Bacteroidetes bacterium]|nr:HYR domain-containing protein [Bacteroidota bacterium]